MTSLRKELVEQLARFDDEAYAALANRGLLRRAQKDLEKLSADIVEEADETLTMTVGEHRIRFDARGPAKAQCSCPASGVCQHILAAAITLQRLASEVLATTTTAEVEIDPLDRLQTELLNISAQELLKHAGKAGYRWAWQFVQDIDPDQGLMIAGERHLVLGFNHPRISFRYMGGGIDAMIADADTSQIEKYRVAVILAYQRVLGVAATPPEDKAKPRNAALDLGKDHANAEVPAEALEESRRRLRDSTLQLFRESVELGLSHLSRGIHERYATLAVWAQGSEYYRLALLLRRAADHVELLLERAGSADEHLLLDELTLAYGLVSALDQAAASGTAPHHLVGRARSRYEEAKPLELLGLGANAWRSPAGYIGLTMLFWSPSDQTFLSCSDARPETQRGFNPIARYSAAGPWSGLGAPQLVTGRRFTLAGAQINAAGRLSAAESASATVLPSDPPDSFAKQLQPQNSWAEIVHSRKLDRRSLLAEPQPMKDWVVLHPARVAQAQFDTARQTMVWPLFDGDGRRLDLELRYDDFTSHAIARIEALRPDEMQSDTMVVARLRAGANGLVGEPLSLVHPHAGAGEKSVDALYFDAPKERGLASKFLDKLRLLQTSTDLPTVRVATTSGLPAVLREFKHWLQRQAERGTADDQANLVRAEARDWIEQATSAGFDSFQQVLNMEIEAAAMLLRLNYLWLQHERLVTKELEDED